MIEPLHSRCSVVDFNIPKSEKPNLASEFMKRMVGILQNENVEYDKKVLVEVIQRHFPDWRRILNELQRYSVSGRIDAGILTDIAEINIKELMNYMKKKEFTNVRKMNLKSDETVSVGHPCLSQDGNMLIFASDMESSGGDKSFSMITLIALY